jgi:hypothetical protein
MLQVGFRGACISTWISLNFGMEFQGSDLRFSASFELEAKRKLPERESACSRLQMQQRA